MRRRRAARRTDDRRGRATLARELGIDLVAGSIVERREGHEKLANTSVHVGPDGEITRRLPQDPHVRRDGRRASSTASPRPRSPATRSCSSELADGTALGLTVCYDLRFPELFRILALRGARVITLPAAFTKVTGEAHWEVLLRARAIENQAFVVAADQIGTHPPDKESFGGSMIVDPWGEVLARARRRGVLRRRRPRPRPPGRGARQAAEPGQPRRRRPTAGPTRRPPDGRRAATGAVDKRRLILDAAIRVFARQGFHACRVSDVADEAGVAYGLVYHYFDSKEEILNTLFTRALAGDARRDRRDRRAAGHPGAREALHGRRRSSSTPTATTPT